MTTGSPVHASPETRARLLTAAGRLFSARGFRAVTVREICREARANVAAVNYHFGGKLGLYRDVIREAIAAMRDATEAARLAGAGRHPDDQLRGYVTLFLDRLAAPEHQTIAALIDREMSDPTPALDDLVEQGVRPRLEYLSGVIAAMIGCDPSDPRVLMSVLSVQSQSLMYARRNAVAERLGFSAVPSRADVDRAARHIADFSIGGINAIARASAAPASRAGAARIVTRRRDAR